MTTLDAHLLALDMKTGNVVWDVEMEDFKKGYAATIAPLVVKDKVIVGTAGGEYGCRCFIDAYDANTGKRAWRFFTIPGPGEPGNETWAGDSWSRGGSSIWVTAAYDPELNLAYFGTGNPGPDYHSESRKGDNLYSDSVVALDVDTGKLRWHYQFTPHDLHDWDSTQVPILADLTIGGQQRKTLMWANRNGFFYTIDRTNGKVILAKPFVRVTWAKEIDANGRPVLLPGNMPDEKGSLTCPGYHRRHQLLSAQLRSGAAAVLRHGARGLRDLLRVEAGVHARRSLHRRRRPARERIRLPGVRRHPRDRSDHGRSQVGVQAADAGRGRHPDDRVGAALRRRQRRQPAGARLAQRQAALELPAGIEPARHVADDLHARRTAASARAGGHVADRVGAARRQARASDAMTRAS